MCQFDWWKHKHAKLLFAKRSEMWLFHYSSAITSSILTGWNISQFVTAQNMCLGTSVHVCVQTWLWLHDYITRQGTNVCGHKRVWAQTFVGTNVCGHKNVWAQKFVATKMSGHKRLWAQKCLDTNVSEHKRVCAQKCLGTNLSEHKRLLAQKCLGTIVWSP